MGLFSKDIRSFDDLLLHGLQDIYYVEHQILNALPTMIDKTANLELAKGLTDHLAETQKQVGRLDQVFNMLGHEPKGVKCPAIDGLISKANEVARARSTTKTCSTPRSSTQRRPSSTTKWRSTAR